MPPTSRTSRLPRTAPAAEIGRLRSTRADLKLFDAEETAAERVLATLEDRGCLSARASSSRGRPTPRSFLAAGDVAISASGGRADFRQRLGSR